MCYRQNQNFTKSVADPRFAKGEDHGELASLNGVWGQSPQPGPEPLVGDQGDEVPLKLKAFCPYKKVAKS